MSKCTPGTFENFMMDKHADQYIGTKDGMVDDCGDWLEGLSVDEWLEFGDKYIKKEGINVELLEACKEFERITNCDWVKKLSDNDSFQERFYTTSSCYQAEFRLPDRSFQRLENLG